MRVPIACTLTVDDAATRLDEWRSLLTRVVSSVERPAPTELVFHIHAGARSEAGALADLVQREATCCSFFEFALHVAAGAITLHATVPPDAAAILDEFADLANTQPAG